MRAQMRDPHLSLTIQPFELAVAKLPPGDQIPAWATSSAFFSITRTADELSLVVCDAAIPQATPDGMAVERGWSAFKVDGPLDFELVGILSSIAHALATWQGGISLFAISTFDTDYVLVKTAELRQAAIALVKAGHLVGPASTILEAPLALGSHVHKYKSHAELCAMPEVPVRYQGLWQMTREQVGEQPEAEASELVFWLQTSVLYTDMRIPKAQVAVRAKADPASAATADPALLMEQYGFAGCLEVDAELDVCTWHRMVEFSPPNGVADVGVNVFSEDGTEMRESSMPGHYRKYTETWKRLAGPQEGVLALKLLHDSAGTREGFWLIMGTYFSYVVGRRSPCTAQAPASKRPRLARQKSADGESDTALHVEREVASRCCKNLAHLVALRCAGVGTASALQAGLQWEAVGGDCSAACAAVYSYEAHMGRVVVRPGGCVRFDIEHSFDPTKEGVGLLHEGDCGARIVPDHATSQLSQHMPDGSVRCWKVAEASAGFDLRWLVGHAR